MLFRSIGGKILKKYSDILLEIVSIYIKTESTIVSSHNGIIDEYSDTGIGGDRENADKGTYEDFRDALGFRESSDNYQVVNRYGYMGRYQFWKAALQDIGFKDLNNNWTEKAKSYGISCDQDFLNSPSAQDEAFNLLVEKQLSYISSYKLDSYIGKTIDGVLITESGLVAASHLIGIGDLCKALEANNLTSVADGNGVKAKEYMDTFGGYDLSEFK